MQRKPKQMLLRKSHQNNTKIILKHILFLNKSKMKQIECQCKVTLFYVIHCNSSVFLSGNTPGYLVQVGHARCCSAAESDDVFHGNCDQRLHQRHKNRQ